jgi:hypothetical protein
MSERSRSNKGTWMFCHKIGFLTLYQLLNLSSVWWHVNESWTGKDSGKSCLIGFLCAKWGRIRIRAFETPTRLQWSTHQMSVWRPSALSARTVTIFQTRTKRRLLLFVLTEDCCYLGCDVCRLVGRLLWRIGAWLPNLWESHSGR